ncbi:hypothetical protein ACLOJK_022346 [Asimina triloba]
MGRSYLLAFLVILAVSGHYCFAAQGFGRKEMGFGNDASSTQVKEVEEEIRGGRAMTEFTMDYQEPGANTNPSSGYILAPPPASP